MNTSDGIGRRRRTHSPEFKAKVVAACRKPGVSIAAVVTQERAQAVDGIEAISAAPAGLNAPVLRNYSIWRGLAA